MIHLPIPENPSKNTWQTVWKDLPAYKSETITEEDREQKQQRPIITRTM